jgi:Flp pilus assembly protein TadD
MVLPHGAPEPVAAQAVGDTPLRQGLALYQARQWEAAAAHLEEAVRSSPQGVRALAYLGAARYATGQYPEAVEAFRRASALQPRNPRLHYDLASALLGAGELDEARREFEAARSLDPTYTAAGAAIAALNGMHVPG